MAEISNNTPIGPAWPSRPVKPSGQSGERRSPARHQPGDDEEKIANDNEDDPQHIDEYA